MRTEMIEMRQSNDKTLANLNKIIEQQDKRITELQQLLTDNNIQFHKTIADLNEDIAEIKTKLHIKEKKREYD
jgi:ABC-type transporter Mla subunit MlaD